MRGYASRKLRRSLHLPPVTERRSESVIERCHGIFKRHMPNAAERIGLDRDEVARLTQSMRRDSWQPKSINHKDIIREYLDMFGSFKSTELERFGITPVIARRVMGKMNFVRMDRYQVGDEENWGYWVMETK